MSEQESFTTPNAYTQTFKIFVCMIAIVLAGFYLLSSVLIPVIISFTLYAIFEPATLYLVRNNINHSLAIVIVLVFLVFFSLIAIGFALPQLVEQIGLLQAKLPSIFSKLEGFLTQYSTEFSDKIGADLDVSDMIISTLSQSSSLGQSLLLNISNKLLGVTIVLLLVPFLTYYLLKDFRSVRNRMMNWLPNTSFELGWLIYHRVSQQLQAYTRGVMIQSITMSLVCMIGFSLIGLDIPILLGAITGILNLVPYVGPVISILLSLLVASAMT
ncbi:MAG: putative permease, partial [Rubritalea sp.]